MTPTQQRRLAEWFAAQRAAGRLRTQTVYGAASAATRDLGFAVDHRDAAAAWNAQRASDRAQKAGARS